MPIPKRTRDALAHGSNFAQGALALTRVQGVADPVGPRGAVGSPAARPATAGAPAGNAASESGPAAGGGFVAAIVALAVAMCVLAFVARRRRAP